jgi:hypothetical protein
VKSVRLLSISTVLALTAVLMQLAASPVLGQEPSPGSVPVTTPQPEGNPPPDGAGSLLGFLPDPKQWAADVFNQVLVTLLRGISDALHRVVGGVLDSALNFITQTPPAGSYASPTVKTVWGVVRAIANAALAVVAMWGGFNLLAREHLGLPYHGAMELFPRLALGALLANTSLAWAQLVIDANNALCQTIGEASLPAWERADAATQQLVDVLAILIYLVTSLLLLLQMLMRLALVDVLLVVAPLGLLCWVLPQTQGWARLWSATFFTAIFTQFVQVLALKLGGSLLMELTPMASDAALLAVFLGVAVMALTIKIPGLLRMHVGDGLSFARYYVYRQGARTLEGRSGAGSAASRAGGGR